MCRFAAPLAYNFLHVIQIIKKGEGAFGLRMDGEWHEEFVFLLCRRFHGVFKGHGRHESAAFLWHTF